MSAVVFGASGPVGLATIQALVNQGHPSIVAVSRSGRLVASGLLEGAVTGRSGDALNANEVRAICEGAAVIYCCIGLPYNSVIWERDFPVIVDNLLAAAAEVEAPLIWADNLYCFGKEHTGKVLMERSTEFTTKGRKPALRAKLDRRILTAAATGRVMAAIVRASDFYGPGVTVSTLGGFVFPALLEGTKALLTADATTKHTFTYVPDFAAALVAVGSDPTAWGQAWHVPNALAIATADVLRRIVALENARRVAEHQQPLPVKFTVLTRLMRYIVGLVMPVFQELAEMQYAYTQDYLVDSSQFTQHFPTVTATPLDEGLLATINWYKTRTV
jgi:nucleoside-diphosphate-sugar epimerase